MKVIDKPEKYSSRINCDHCGALLEVEPEDVKSVYTSGKGFGSSEKIFIFHCPCCSVDFGIIGKNLSNIFKQKYMHPEYFAILKEVPK